MLSSAHILAMDTKNLLDVCDSIRARFPNIKYDNPDASKDPARLPQPQTTLSQQSPVQQEEVYENIAMSGVAEQIYCNQAPPTEIGIYDNHAAIQEQLRIVEEPTSPVDSQFNSQKILSN